MTLYATYQDWSSHVSDNQRMSFYAFARAADQLANTALSSDDDIDDYIPDLTEAEYVAIIQRFLGVDLLAHLR